MEVSANSPHDVRTARVDCYFELFLAQRRFRFPGLHLLTSGTMVSENKDESVWQPEAVSSHFGQNSSVKRKVIVKTQ